MTNDPSPSLGPEALRREMQRYIGFLSAGSEPSKAADEASDLAESLATAWESDRRRREEVEAALRMFLDWYDGYAEEVIADRDSRSQQEAVADLRAALTNTQQEGPS